MARSGYIAGFSSGFRGRVSSTDPMAIMGRWIKRSGWYPNYRQPQFYRNSP
jgi:hypothetical protein